MGPDAGDDHVHCTRTDRLMLHYLSILAILWIVALVVAPQQTLAATFVAWQFGWQFLEKFLS